MSHPAQGWFFWLQPDVWLGARWVQRLLPPALIPTGTAAQATDRRQPTLQACWSPAVASADACPGHQPVEGNSLSSVSVGSGQEGPRARGSSSPFFTATSEIQRVPGICSKSSHPAAHFIDRSRATAPPAPPALPLPLVPNPHHWGLWLLLPPPCLSLQASGRAGIWRGLCDSAAAESPGLSVN